MGTSADYDWCDFHASPSLIDHLTFRPKLKDIAQGLIHIHDLGIIHGNLKIVRLSLHSNAPLRPYHVVEQHIGRSRWYGLYCWLGSAFVPSQNHVSWSEMDAELLFYGSAPELVHPNPPKSRIRTTKESDVYAFALLAWEVSYSPPMLF